MKKKIILVILFLVVSLIGTGLVYGFNTLSQITAIVGEPKLNKSELKVNNDLDIDTVNIAVFGIDGRSDVDGDRADTIMVLSMDFRNGTVKVTSIMRDLMVQIPATDDTYENFDKINASYAYGGPELTVKTLNENFDLNITDYIVVNFDAMVDTVDALGGVEINVKNEDVLEWTNKYIDDVNEKVGKSDPKLEAIGPQTVTGVQALAYARNRFSDDDFGRTERQREVVGQIAKKGFQIDAITGVNLLGKVYPYVKTTLSIKELTTYAKSFLESTDKEFLESRVPADKFVTDAMINNVSYVIPNSLADNVIALHAFIYGPKQTQVAAEGTSTSGTTSTSSSNSSTYTPYVPTDRVMEISDAIASYVGSSPSVTITTDDSEGSYSEPYSDTTTDTTYEDTTDTTTYEPTDYDTPTYEPIASDPIVLDPTVSEPVTNDPITTDVETTNPGSETTGN